MNHQTHGLRNVLRLTVSSHRLLTLGLAAVVAASVAVGLLPPLVLERIVNELTGTRRIAMPLAALYFGALLLSGVLDAAKALLITVFGQKITHGLRSAMCRKLQRLPAAYFTENDAGSLTSRFVNDVDTVESLFDNGVISMCADACKVIGIIAVIFTKSIGLGVLLLIAAPLVLLITRTFQKKMLTAQKKNRAAVGRVNNYIPETIRNIRTVHNLRKEAYMERNYDAKIQESYRAVEKTNLYDSIYSPIIILLSTAVIAALMLLSAMGGGMQTFFGMSVGTAVAVIAYVNQVFGPIESIGMEIQNIQSAAAGISRIDELLGERERPEPDSCITLKDLSAERAQGIRLEDVTFAYEEGQTVLNHLTLRVENGELVTLAGRTGIGKSTIFKLLLGLYQPQEGRVLIFGQDAARIPDGEKRRLFGYVEQSFHPVPGTVAEQITLYDEGIGQPEVERAARLAGIHDVITKLPAGYETEYVKTSLSQGQIQLLSIARAVAADPAILLLDEITANLDSVTEGEVLHALERAAAGRTVLSISHRLHENTGGRLIRI
jgi:ATP-binding cassette subfamily B multidrug efflux pump